jgi:hypothetical protein
MNLKRKTNGMRFQEYCMQLLLLTVVCRLSFNILVWPAACLFLPFYYLGITSLRFKSCLAGLLLGKRGNTQLGINIVMNKVNLFVNLFFYFLELFMFWIIIQNTFITHSRVLQIASSDFFGFLFMWAGLLVLGFDAKHRVKTSGIDIPTYCIYILFIHVIGFSLNIIHHHSVLNF